MSLRSDVWSAVIRAIEDAIPEYDPVNEKVSLGLAQKTRSYAVQHLNLRAGMLALDAGIGPGTMSEAILKSDADLTIVGLDASATLLNAARERLQGGYGSRVHFVRGVFEAVPIRDGCFERIVSAYAFRDARNRTVAIEEFHRVAKDKGIFGIVDLGKPSSRVKRFFIDLYVGYFMPLIAKFSKSSAIAGNPWRMIYPTYQALGKNSELVEALKTRFSDVSVKEFALGGVIFVTASKGASNDVQKQTQPSS